MNVKVFLATAGFLTATVATIAPAQATPSFTTFTFNTNYSFRTPSGTIKYSPTPANPTRDIKLESVSFAGNTVSQFNLVNRADILHNDMIIPAKGQAGPGSSDHGDNTVSDVYLPQGPAIENPTNADVVASLGNLNLNSIIDTEDNLGTSSFNVFFDHPSNSFFLFERGMNSDLQVDAIDAKGNVIAGQSFKITRDLWKDAGYGVDTTEINGTQEVGSYGIRFNTDVAGLRLSSYIGFNGPDYKVVAAHVPEPSALVGLGVASGSLFLLRRRRFAKA